MQLLGLARRLSGGLTTGAIFDFEFSPATGGQGI